MMRGTDVKLWLAQQNLKGTVGKRYADVGALWFDGRPGFGETISIAAKYTSDLTIIDPAVGWWPPVRDKLAALHIDCQYLPIDVLSYDGPPFDLCQCAGLLYHMPNSDLLWRKLTNITRERLVIHTVAVPEWIMADGRQSLIDCDADLRMKIEHFWNRHLSPRWIRPEQADEMPKYAPIYTAYSARQFRQEAKDYGWSILMDVAWQDGLNVALLLER